MLPPPQPPVAPGRSPGRKSVAADGHHHQTSYWRSFLHSVSTPIDATLERSTDNLDWLIRAAKDAGDDSMVFASTATGPKSAVFNTVNGSPEQRQFDDEDTLTYELGVKSTVLDQRLRINTSAFYTQINDFQSQQQLETGIGTFVSNASKVEASGLDFQMEALPLPNLTLSAGLLYMHKYEVTEGPDEGLELPFTADYSGNLAATLVFALGDGGIYWRNDHWNISLWGRNLTDDHYASQTVATFVITGMDACFLSEPMTHGATVRYDF